MSTSSEFKSSECFCFYCHNQTVQYQVVESYDEAYEDYYYKCFTCLQTWWSEGIDS